MVRKYLCYINYNFVNLLSTYPRSVGSIFVSDNRIISPKPTVLKRSVSVSVSSPMRPSSSKTTLDSILSPILPTSYKDDCQNLKHNCNIFRPNSVPFLEVNRLNSQTIFISEINSILNNLFLKI